LLTPYQSLLLAGPIEANRSDNINPLIPIAAVHGRIRLPGRYYLDDRELDMMGR
jgi:hypothetical protein